MSAGNAAAGAAPSRPDLALFDFDGTLTTRETFADFLHVATPPRRRAAGRVLLAPAVIAYKLGLLPVASLRALLVRYCFTGVARSALETAGADFASTVLPGLLRPEAMARLHWHQARGDTVVVVSGGCDVYLSPWCAAHGVALLCSTLDHRDGRMTGRYAGAQCAGEEKARRVRAHFNLAGFAAVHAYGDTHEDLALLALADHAIYQGAPWTAAGDADRAVNRDVSCRAVVDR